MGNEDNSSNKEKIRAWLGMEIDSYFGDRKYSMLELLGAGVGAEFFLAKQKGLQKLSCVESDKYKYQHWMINKLDPLQRLYSTKCSIDTFHINLYKFYRKTKERYDVINFDSMSFAGPKVYRTPGRYSIYEHVQGIFRNKVMADNGLLLLNVIVGGGMSNLNPRRHEMLTDANDIWSHVAEAADGYNYDIDISKCVGQSYKGESARTWMFQSVIPVSKR